MQHRPTWDALVRRERALDGKSSKLGWMRVTIGAVPVRTAKFLMLGKREAGQVPEVVHLQSLSVRSGLQRWTQVLRAAGLHRCAR
jgi:hypothetical protein